MKQLLIPFLLSAQIVSAQTAEPSSRAVYKVADQVIFTDSVGVVKSAYPRATVLVQAYSTTLILVSTPTGPLYYTAAKFLNQAKVAYGSTVSAAITAARYSDLPVNLTPTDNSALTNGAGYLLPVTAVSTTFTSPVSMGSSLSVTGAYTGTGNLSLNGTNPMLIFNGNRYLSRYGTNNTVLGENAGSTSSTGSGRTIMGFNAAPSATGTGLVVIGQYTYYNGTTGDGSVYIGTSAAGGGTFTGGGNTFVGNGAGNKSGVSHTNSILIGSGVGTNVSGTSYNNVILLGNDAGNGAGNLSNTMLLGSSGSAYTLKTYGDVYVASSSKGYVLTSPDGTCYRITVANGGTLNAPVSITCP